MIDAPEGGDRELKLPDLNGDGAGDAGTENAEVELTGRHAHN